jgi:hypothetical protein
MFYRNDFVEWIILNPMIDLESDYFGDNNAFMIKVKALLQI